MTRPGVLRYELDEKEKSAGRTGRSRFQEMEKRTRMEGEERNTDSLDINPTFDEEVKGKRRRKKKLGGTEKKEEFREPISSQVGGKKKGDRESGKRFFILHREVTRLMKRRNADEERREDLNTTVTQVIREETGRETEERVKNGSLVKGINALGKKDREKRRGKPSENNLQGASTGTRRREMGSSKKGLLWLDWGTGWGGGATGNSKDKFARLAQDR